MKGIRIIPMQIGMIGKGFKASESKFKRFETDLKHFNSSINANFKHFKGIRSIRTICDSNQSNGNSND